MVRRVMARFEDGSARRSVLFLTGGATTTFEFVAEFLKVGKSRYGAGRLPTCKGPVNNVLVVRTQAELENTGTSLSRKQALRLPPPLNKYTSSTDESVDLRPMTTLHSPSCGSLDAFYLSSHVMDLQVEQLQQKGSSAATDIELERLRSDCKKSLQIAQQWKKMYEDLHQFCVNELVDGGVTK